MNILLVGNYEDQGSQSMQRFAEVLCESLQSDVVSVEIIRPKSVLAKLFPNATTLRKWIGYFDALLIFPLILALRSRHADRIHICDQANAVYVDCLPRAKVSITCHDVLAIRSAQGFFSANKVSLTGRIRQAWILSRLKKINRIVCVSEKTKSELLEVLGATSNIISVVHNCLNYPYGKLSESASYQQLVALGLEPETRFFFHVGGNQWYKNRLGLLKIYRQIRLLDPQAPVLVMAGKPWPEELKRYVYEFDLVASVVDVGTVSNETLEALYTQCEAMIFPSLAEGFGWPVIEAQACKSLVFTSDIEPINQLAGGGAFLFEPDDAEAAATLIVSVLSDPMSQEKRLEGFANSQNFLPELFAREYLATISA